MKRVEILLEQKTSSASRGVPSWKVSNISQETLPPGQKKMKAGWVVGFKSSLQFNYELIISTWQEWCGFWCHSQTAMDVWFDNEVACGWPQTVKVGKIIVILKRSSFGVKIRGHSYTAKKNISPRRIFAEKTFRSKQGIKLAKLARGLSEEFLHSIIKTRWNFERSKRYGI